MPIPKPRAGEQQDKFISRCIKQLKKIDPNRPQKQIIAICYDSWKRKKEGKMKDYILNYVVPIKETFRENDDFLIRGIAINETVTRNGIKYVAEELEKSAVTLKNKPILKDHVNSVDSIIGKVVNAIYDKNIRGITFEGKVMDKDIRNKIEKGLITSVSVGAMVKNLAEEKLDNDEKVLKAQGIDFVELSLVAVPADPNAGFAKAIAEAYKIKEDEEEDDDIMITEAVWDTKYINDLPDAAFAYIAPGGEKDKEGKTKPRSLRYLPHHTANVKSGAENNTVDIPHLRNALARAPQAKIPPAAKKSAIAHLEKHAKALLKTKKEEEYDNDLMEIKSLLDMIEKIKEVEKMEEEKNQVPEQPKEEVKKELKEEAPKEEPKEETKTEEPKEKPKEPETKGEVGEPKEETTEEKTNYILERMNGGYALYKKPNEKGIYE